MESRNLSIGNIVSNKNGYYEEVRLIEEEGFINGFTGCQDHEPDCEDDFSGIQFNDKWAVLFGYECSQELAVGFDELGKFSFKVNGKQLNEMKVHEVQNLFFALNKNELEYTSEDLRKMNLNRD